MSDSENEEPESPVPSPEVSTSQGINWKQVLPISAIPFSRYMSNSMLTVMEPFMTRRLLHLHVHQIGFYSALMIMMGFLGSSLGNATLARAAEVFGRKRVLLASLLSASFFCLLFGASQAFWWALLARLAWGYSGGNFAVAHTMLCESVERDQRPRVFSLRGVWSALGRIIGPVAAGFLSEPAEKYSAMNVAFFRHVPFILPCLVLVTINLIIFVLIFFCVTDTHPQEQPDRSTRRVLHTEDSDTTTMDEDDVMHFSRTGEIERSVAEEDRASETQPLPWYRRIHLWLNSHRFQPSSWSRAHYSSIGMPTRRRATPCQRCCQALRRFRGNFNALLEYYLTPYRENPTNAVILCTLLLWALGMQSSTAVIALILLQRPTTGGFCMDSAHLGLMVTTGSAASLLVQLLLYPTISRFIGLRRTFYLCCFLLGVLLLILPWLSTWLVPLFQSGSEGQYNGTAYVVEVNKNHLGLSQSQEDIPSEDAFLNDWPDVTASHLPFNSDGTGGNSLALRAPEAIVSPLRHSVSNARSAQVTYSESKYILVQSKDAGRHRWRCPVRERTAQSGKHGGNAKWSFKISAISFMTGAVWTIVALHIALIYVSRGLAGTTIVILLNNAADDTYRVRLNAVGEIGIALCSLVGPSSLSAIFAWCTRNNLYFPLNYHFAFWILAYILLCAASVARSLSSHVEVHPSHSSTPTNS